MAISGTKHRMSTGHCLVGVYCSALGFLLMFLLILLLGGCETGVDKNQEDPHPAVGRTSNDTSETGDHTPQRAEPTPGSGDTLR